MSITPTRIGSLSCSKIKEGQSVSLHSQFEHGLNVETKNGFVFLGLDQGICVPFGMHFSHVDWQKIQQAFMGKPPLFIESDGCLKIGHLMIDARNAERMLGEIQLQTIDRATIKKIISRILPELSGMGLDFSEVTSLKWHQKNNFLEMTEIEIASFIQYYIGRGLGLTPSGDDMLVGLLAMNQVTSFLPAQFKSELSHYLLKDVTTTVSKEYLVAALSGSFSSILVELTENMAKDVVMFQKTTRQLLDFGSTSGKDTLTGIYMGLLQILLLEERRGFIE